MSVTYYGSAATGKFYFIYIYNILQNLISKKGLVISNSDLDLTICGFELLSRSDTI